MASKTSNYKLLLEAALDPEKVNAQIAAIQQKSKLYLKVEFQNDDFAKLQAKIAEINQKAQSISKVTIMGDTAGGINKAIITYKDFLGNVVQEYAQINESVKITQSYTENLAKDEEAINKLKERQAALSAKQADEMGRAALQAEQFLAKAQNMNKTPSVQAAIDTANQIKQAYSEGNIQRVRELNEQLQIQKAALQTGATVWQSWATGMKRALMQTIEYGMSVGLLYGTLAKLKEGIQYISDLNAEMTKIQVLQVQGAQTNSQVADLANQYNRLAQSVGATTLEVAQGSVEWLRQGKTIAETKQLLQSTMMLSKLGAMDSAEATEKLTAILNGYNMSADQATSVVSKLVAVDNIAATSSNELATALQYSSAVAQQSGVSFEQLTAMVGAVSNATRLSAEMIGQAFKTIFTRMESVKAGEIDETGMSLNNVEKSLSAVGIKLRDAANSFRPMGDVIAEVASKWKDFDEVQKAQIANAIAGVRQGQIFISLMQNYGDVQKYMTAETNSAGLAQQRYAIYLNSVEAAQNRAKAAWEGMWQASIKSNAIKWVYDLEASFLNLITEIGGLPTILGLVTAALILFNNAAIATSASLAWTQAQSVLSFFPILIQQIQNATVVQWLWNAALDANPLGLIVAAIGVAIGAFVLFGNQTEKLQQKVEKLENEFTNLATTMHGLQADKNTITELYTEFDKLNSKTSRTVAEQQRWYEIQNELKQLLPEVNGYYDDQGNFILAESDNLEGLLKLKQQEIDLAKEKLQLDAKKGIQSEIDLYKKLTGEVKQYEDVLNAAHGDRGGKTGGMTDAQIQKTRDDLQDASIRLRESQSRVTEFFNALNEADQQLFLEAAKGTELYNLLSDAMLKNSQIKLQNAQSAAGAGATPFSPVVSDESKKALEDLHKMVVDMIKQQKNAEIDALQEELNAFKDKIDAEKQGLQDEYDAEERRFDQRKTHIQREKEDYDSLIDKRVQALRDEQEAINKAIDAEKELLSEKQASLEYDRKRQDNQDALTKLENQIAELSLDTSAEGIAERQKLEEQAAELKKKMGEDAQDNEIRLQQQALDDEKKAQEERLNLRIKELEAEKEIANERYDMRLRQLEDEQTASKIAYDNKIRDLQSEYDAFEASQKQKIADIKEYLSQEGTINNDAMNMLLDNNSNVYQQLIDWNKKYGTGIDEDITQAWTLALDALNAYKDSLVNMPAAGSNTSPTSWGGGENTAQPPSYHSGADAGFVGHVRKSQSNEEFAKLLKGELVLKPSQMDNFMKNILPQMAQTTAITNGGDIAFSMPITVEGNLDSTVMPQLEELVNKAIRKLNDSLANRGFMRRADMFSI